MFFMSTQSFLLIAGADEAQGEISKLLKQFGIGAVSNSLDLATVEPLKKETTLGQVLDVKATIFQKPLDLPYKVVIFKEAHTLNTIAQNALLKILEEPPAHALLILQTDNPQTILPTIHSRVVRIWAKRKKEETILENYRLSRELLLQEIPQIEDAGKWLSFQIFSLTKLLKNQIGNSLWREAMATTTNIKLCVEAKKLIDSNVSPNFVLAGLALSL